MKIIVVDDSLLDRKLLTRSLANSGVKNEILQADNGEAGLELIAGNIGDIAVVFLDYQMPKMSGIEVLGALGKVPATLDIPIIMITASAAEESRQAAYAAYPRLAGYLIKPFKPDQLLAMVRPYVVCNG
jgi:two-component system chemotaxis response regulator CheY